MRRARGPIAVALLWLGAFAGAYWVGRAGTGGVLTTQAVVLHGGIPVGVVDTAAGAIAAAAECAAAVQRTSALAPRLFDGLVHRAYTPAAGQRVLVLAREARSSDPPLAGVHLLTATAAARLDRFSAGSALVGVWLEATYWSPQIEPTQTWALEQLELRWRNRRWQLAAQTEGVAPVPAWASVRDHNDTSSAFDLALAGMRDVDYGAP